MSYQDASTRAGPVGDDDLSRLLVVPATEYTNWPPPESSPPPKGPSARTRNKTAATKTAPQSSPANRGDDQKPEPLPSTQHQPPSESGSQVTPSQPDSPLLNRREFLYCRAVVHNPFLPSSRYPKLAGISPKTAQPIRDRLIVCGLLRTHKQDTSGRGRSSLLIEPLPAALEAVRNWEAVDER